MAWDTMCCIFITLQDVITFNTFIFTFHGNSYDKNSSAWNANCIFYYARCYLLASDIASTIILSVKYLYLIVWYLIKIFI